jgi:DNA-binding NtrC family response regulator
MVAQGNVPENPRHGPRELSPREGTLCSVNDETLNSIIRRAAREMLERCGGNKSDAARRLGISRTRLQRLLDATARAERSPADWSMTSVNRIEGASDESAMSMSAPLLRSS